MIKKEERKYKARFNEKRDCYISRDEKYLCYRIIDIESGKTITERYEIGKDGITEELAMLIDGMNAEEDLNERYTAEKSVVSFDLFEDSEVKNSSLGIQLSTECLNGKPEWQFRDESIGQKAMLMKIRSVIDTECNERQQRIYYEHFGMQKQLEEIRKEESVADGVEKSLQAIVNVKNDIIRKASSALGVEPVKRHKYPKQQK